MCDIDDFTLPSLQPFTSTFCVDTMDYDSEIATTVKVCCIPWLGATLHIFPGVKNSN